MSKTKKESGFTQIFMDNNEYNEKTVIGFLSFAVMTLYSLVDLVTGIMGIPLEIHEYVYNSFMIITLGSFGIAGLEKFSPTAVKQAETTKEEEKKEELDPYA
jgi:hypothetical protein